jgi:hypothetical protein
MAAPDNSRPERLLRDRPAMIFGALGLLAGIASALCGYRLEIDWLQPVARLFALQSGLLPIGIIFAVAIALAHWLVARSVPYALLALLVTIYAWSGALHIAIRLQRNVDDTAHLLAASLAAGAFGAGLTHLGVSAGLPGVRGVRPVAITCVVGAMFGMLFFLGERRYVDPHALFLLWQPAVAFAIGLAAGRLRAA